MRVIRYNNEFDIQYLVKERGGGGGEGGGEGGGVWGVMRDVERGESVEG